MKTRKTALLTLGIALAALTAAEVSAQSSFTATYDFSSVVASSGGTTDPTPPPVVTGLTFGSFPSTGASANPNAGSRFSFTSQPLGGVNGVDDFSQFTGSLNVAAYFEVSITPLSSIELQLDTIAFTVQRSGTGIRNYAVRSSVDGYAANLAASVNPANLNLAVGAGNEFQWVLDAQTGANNGSQVTLGLPHSSLTTPVTFRFYGWNAEAGTGTFSVDNVAFSGSTRGSVPEPAAATLLALGLTAVGICRRGGLKKSRLAC
jgi:trimeric autotransporter adhesin